MKKKLQDYTVVGYYDDNGNIWVEHVTGHDTNEAVVKAVKKLEKSNGQEEFSDSFRKNVNIVEVFCGTHKGQTDNESVSAAIDWPGLETD